LISPRAPQPLSIVSPRYLANSLVSVRGYATLAQTKFTVINILCSVAVGSVPSFRRDQLVREVLIEALERCFESTPKEIRVGIFPPKALEFHCTDRSLSQGMAAVYSNVKLQNLVYGLVDPSQADEETRTLFNLLEAKILPHVRNPEVCLSCNTLLMLSRARKLGRCLTFQRHLIAD